MKTATRKVFQRYLSHTEEKLLLGKIAEHGHVLARRDHAWMRLLRHTGIRVGALHGLTVQDAKAALKSGHLQVRAEINKGGRAYAVYLNKKAHQALKDLLALRRDMGHGDNPDMPLVMSRTSKAAERTDTALSVRSFQARMQHWVRLAGLSIEASPHWFRHTLAKRLMQQSTARDPRAIVQPVLGHASANSTMIYTLPDRQDIEQAMEEAA